MAKQGEDIKPKEEAKKKTSSSLLLLLLIAIFAALGYFLVWPEYTRFLDIQDKLTSEKQKLAEQETIFQDTKKLLANYEDISAEDKEKINAMLPEEIDEPGLFTLFESLAQKNKIAVLSLDISEKEAAANLKNFGIMEVQIALNLTAGPASEDPYGDFKKFLSDIEANLRLMDIISINYTPESTTYVLNIKTYRIEPTAKAVPAAAITP